MNVPTNRGERYRVSSGASEVATSEREEGGSMSGLVQAFRRWLDERHLERGVIRHFLCFCFWL